MAFCGHVLTASQTVGAGQTWMLWTPVYDNGLLPLDSRCPGWNCVTLRFDFMDLHMDSHGQCFDGSCMDRDGLQWRAFDVHGSFHELNLKSYDLSP